MTNLKDIASRVALEASYNGLNPNTIAGATALVGNLPDDLFDEIDGLSPDQFLEMMSEAGYQFEVYRNLAQAISLCGGSL
jgi:hypothetical protein